MSALADAMKNELAKPINAVRKIRDRHDFPAFVVFKIYLVKLRIKTRRTVMPSYQVTADLSTETALVSNL